MTEINNNESGNKRSLNSKPRSKKLMPRVDMTPMVDLGFLLISFFMLSMSLNEARAMNLDKRISNDSVSVSECQVMNILIDSVGQIFIYDGLNIKTITQSSFDASSGIRKSLIEKSKSVPKKCGIYATGKPREVICIIKLLPGTRYKSMIDILDEMAITGISTYSFHEPELAEIDQLQETKLLAEK